MMKLLRDYWQWISFSLLLALAIYMVTCGHSALPFIQSLMVYNFMCLLAHQSEEYIFPGGAGVLINRGTYREVDNFRRYPGNSLSSLVVNLSAYIPYILAIFFPSWIWLGIGLMFFNLMQFPGHVIANNKALKTWYNPGMLTTIVLFVPMSCYYFYQIYQLNLVTGWDWFFGTLAFVAMVALTVILPVQSLKRKDSPYEFSEQQVAKFDQFMSWAKISSK